MNANASPTRPAAMPSVLESICIEEAGTSMNILERNIYAETVRSLFREFNVSDVIGKQHVQRIATYRVLMCRQSKALENATRPTYQYHERKQLDEFSKFAASVDATHRAVRMLEANQPLDAQALNGLFTAESFFWLLQHDRYRLLASKRRQLRRRLRRGLLPQCRSFNRYRSKLEARNASVTARRVYGTHVIRDLHTPDGLKAIAASNDPAHDRHRAAILTVLRRELPGLEERLKLAQAKVEPLLRRGPVLANFGRGGSVLPVLRAIHQLEKQIRGAMLDLADWVAGVEASQSAAAARHSQTEPIATPGTFASPRSIERRSQPATHLQARIA